METISQIQKIVKSLSIYQIDADQNSLFTFAKARYKKDDPLLLIDVVDDLKHAAYKAIEEQYAKFDPKASKSEQIKFYKHIIHIKAQLRDLEFVSIDLTKKLNQKGLVYIKQKEVSVLTEKYILEALKGKTPEEIVRVSYYQLLDKIGENKSLKESDREFINSLLMQMISRPEGQKLILKLNWLLETKGATIKFMPSQEFGCASTLSGAAKEHQDHLEDLSDEDTLKNIIKKATIKSEGTKDIVVLMDMNYLKSMSFLNTESYASPGVGLTDLGPPFILLAHELIHATHNLAGSARGSFDSFYQGIAHTEDSLLEMLYPKESEKKVGDAAEEYWTIEAGQLCENSLRRENGFSDRTGHVSAEPGNSAIRDLYYIGRARNYDPEMLEELTLNYQEQQNFSEEERENIDEIDLDVRDTLKIEKFQLQICSLSDVIHELKKISPHSIGRYNRIIEKWKGDVQAREQSSPEENWISLLTTLPVTLTKTLMAISSLNQPTLAHDTNMQLWKDALSEIEITSDDIQKVVSNLIALEDAFRSCMPPDFQNDHGASMRDLRGILEEHDASLQYSFAM